MFEGMVGGGAEYQFPSQEILPVPIAAVSSFWELPEAMTPRFVLNGSACGAGGFTAGAEEVGAGGASAEEADADEPIADDTTLASARVVDSELA